MRKARRIRERRNKSLGDVQDATSINKGQLSRFERGAGNDALLGMAALRRLSRYYRCSLDDLLREEPAVPVG